jgi:cytochrome c biogenesis protein CcdA
VLLLLYSVGLAIPFVLLALVFADPLSLASLRRNGARVGLVD